MPILTGDSTTQTGHINPLCGDLNSDGEMNLTDVILLLNCVGNPTTHPISEDVSDVNCNGVVNMGDVILLLNYVGDPVEYELGCCE